MPEVQQRSICRQKPPAGARQISPRTEIMNKASAIAAEIDKQIEILHRCRSVFPRLDNSLVGQTEFRAPGYYQQLGLDVSVKLSSPMTAEFIDGLFDLGHWINENFVVRLWSIL